MRGSNADHWRHNARPDRTWHGNALAVAPALRARGELPVPPRLLERVRVAAPWLGVGQGDIAAAAIDRFLTEHGF